MAHVLPVADNTILHGVRDLKERPHGSGFIAHHNVLDLEVVHALLGTENRTPDDGGKDMFREIGACIAKLHVSQPPAETTTTTTGRCGACVQRKDVP
jgi:hypothetical protein